mgnify:CR=1 FL=1
MKPTGSFLSFTNENGLASARYAILIVFVLVMAFRRLSGGNWICAEAAVANKKARHTETSRNMIFPRLRNYRRLQFRD